MQNDLTKKAIQAALNCDWERAIDYNTAILRQNPNDIKALNRLARAYLEIGNKDQAKELSEQVLKLDRYNPIALRNLSLIPQKNSTVREIANEDFIEKPGETKLVNLIKLANKDVITPLYSKQPLQLETKNGRLVGVYTKDKQRIGSLPDDLSFKIKALNRKGYQYQACIKSSQNNKVTIFIRETKRPKRYQNLPSFSTALNHQILQS